MFHRPRYLPSGPPGLAILLVATLSLPICPPVAATPDNPRRTREGRAPAPPPRPAADQEVKRAPAAPRPYRVATEQILLRHDKSFHPSSRARTVEEALELARRLVKEIRAGKLDFQQASEKHSDDPASKKNGGYMGIFARDELAAEFGAAEKAIFGLRPGQVSEPIDSPLGVHIFRRIRIREWAGSHILIQYAGCRKAPRALRRTRREAESIARKVLAACLTSGADFAALARRYSEAPDSAVGGSMGIFGRYEIFPKLERSIAALKIGQVGGPVESPLGWHVVRRDPLRRVHAAHILVRYKGRQNDVGVSRNRDDALARAGEILKLVKKPGADFEALAVRYSEEGSSARGGRIGFFTTGKLLPEFEKAVFGLGVGDVSDVVETDHGFHIIKRLPDE